MYCSIYVGIGFDSSLAWGSEFLADAETQQRKPYTQELKPEEEVSECSFEIKEMKKASGVCTKYGACRIEGEDFFHEVCK